MSPLEAAAAPAAGVNPQPTPTDPRVGPYDLVQDGRCALGHPLNGFGRCNELNTGIEVGQ